MKKLSVALLVVAALALPVASSADNVIPDKVTVGNYASIVVQSGSFSNGGPFTITSYQPDQTTVRDFWTTFCLELTETFSPGTTKYYIDDISNNAIKGSVGLTGDPLDDKTKAIYSMFRTGGLASLQALPSLGASLTIGDIQAAIWKLEETGAPTSTLGTALAGKPLCGLGQTPALNDCLTPDALGVAAVNLRTSSSPSAGYVQSMLAIPDPNEFVPEPGSALLLGAGLLGLAAVVRRRK